MAPRRPRRTRTAARVHKVLADDAFVVIPAWRCGAILAKVDIRSLIAATGLMRQQLKGAELTVEVRLDALQDHELDAQGWQLARPFTDRPRWSRSRPDMAPGLASWPESA